MSSSDEEGFSGDEGFESDMEALRRACFLSGTDPNSLPNHSDSDDDLELVRGIKERFNACSEPPLTLKPLSVLLPRTEDEGDDDEEEDDFAILRSIQKRFSRYDNDVVENNKKQQQVPSKNTYPEKRTSGNVELDKTNAPKAVPDSIDMHTTSNNSETVETPIRDGFPSCFTEGHKIGIHDSAMVSTEGCGFPKAAQMFVEAIRKNRACQKFIRNKMMKIEARIEENRKLQHRVKTLRGFQIKCKKETSRALSQKQDLRYQLISAVKLKGKSKADAKDSAVSHGPVENSQVACYKMVVAEYRMSLSRRKWTDEERENLAKGIKQQFQELLLQRSVDSISEVEGDSNAIDDIYASIRERDISSEDMRLFLPKVNWERLASMYLRGRSGAECEARWLNWEDPLINHKPWTSLEDKKLLHIVQQRGISNWIEIAVLLETNRTPFQCLARYQRSLNASVLRSEWSKDEDEKLCAAVAAFGESNWENVAATLVGRTGPQCSNRWIKSLNPAREKTGRWSLDEDKQLKVAVIFFGPKNWKKVAQFVPGRTHVQCRERWANNLDPSLNMGEWTEEEDIKLRKAIVENGYCWSKVAASVASRTDNQCTRRWKELFPHDVSLLQAARKIQKAALISNFVDRESERPALGPNDFIPLALKNAVSESGKQRKKPRFKKATKNTQSCTDKILKNKEKIAGKKNKLKKKPIRRHENRAAETASQEIMLFDGKIKKQKTIRKRRMTLRSKNVSKEAQTDDIMLTKGVNDEKVAGRKTNSKKTTRRSKKNKAGSEATEDARIDQEIVPFDGETKKKKTKKKRKKMSRSEKAIKEAHICSEEISLIHYDLEEVAGEKTNSKKKPTHQCKKNKETSEATVARAGQEILDGETKKKMSTMKRIMRSRELPKEKDRVATSSDDRLPEVERATKPQLKKILGPTNSHVSACGDSEVITMTTVEEVVEHNRDVAGEKNKISSKVSRGKNERCKRINEAASSFGKNEAFSKIIRFSSAHLEQDSHANPTEVNSSPCPNLVSLRVTNVKEAEKVVDVGKRKKGSVISRPSRIKCRALLREASDITEISDSETLGSIILKKREMRRSLKVRNGLDHLSIKSGSIINKEVDAIDELQVISEISKATKKFKNSARDHSCLHGERKGRKPQTFLREASDITEISGSETLGSIILKKREMRRSLKVRNGLDHLSIKSGSIINKEVDAIGELQVISDISKATKKFKNLARDHSCLHGERKGRKPQARKSENAEMGKTLLTVDCGTHRTDKRKRSRIDEQPGNGYEFGEGDEMILASLFKKKQKKRRLTFAPKTPPFGEVSNRPSRIGLVDGHIHCEAGDSNTCSPPPGFEKPIYKTDHLVLV